MTKSTKHKKEFRKEKNKIKLKLSAKAAKSKKTAFLPKGLNVTDTSFKSKKIVLPDNLRPSDDSGIPLTSRKQTFKELISHMGHFNATVQQDGINGMKELLGKFPEILEINLPTLFGKISELLVAREGSVRKSALKLLEFIIQNTKQEKISPFFPLLNAQLLCSMNHIALDIKKDSHLILDLLLTNVPKLVSSVTMQILPDFLEQISCSGEKAGKRILAMNPNQRLTSLKWRQEVLTRIQKLLYLSIKTTEREEDARNANSITWDSNLQNGLLYCKRDFRLKLDLPIPGHLTTKMTSAKNPLQDFIAQLFPLLIETWIEAMASEQVSKGSVGSLISTDSAELLICISNVIFTIWNILSQSENKVELLNWFQTEYGDLLVRHFIQRFPFSARFDQRRKNVKMDSECREQNLIFAFLWAQLNLKSSPKYAKHIFQYLCGLFQTADHQSLTTIELGQLKNILTSACCKNTLHSHVSDLVTAAVEFINRTRPDRKDRLILNKILIEVGLSQNELDGIPALKDWIESCPSLIREDHNASLLNSINEVMSRNVISLSNGRKELEHLLEKLDRYGNKFAHWKATFNFFYWTCRDSADLTRHVTPALQKIIDRLEEKEIQSYGLSVLIALRESSASPI